MTKKVIDFPEKSSTSEELAEQPSLKESPKEFLDRMIKEESRMVTGRFRCYAVPGSTQPIQLKKYKELPFFDKSMTDGCTYTVPLWVARHLNGVDVLARFINGKVNSCCVPVHAYKAKPDGSLPMSTPSLGFSGQPSLSPIETEPTRYDPRFGFESLDFAV